MPNYEIMIAVKDTQTFFFLRSLERIEEKRVQIKNFLYVAVKDRT